MTFMKSILTLILVLFTFTLSAPIIVIHGPNAAVKGGVGLGGSIALVQSNSKDSGTVTSDSIPFNFSNTGGNLLVIAIRQNAGGGAITLTDSAGNTYTLARSTASGSDHTDYVYYAKNSKASANTVFISQASAAGLRMAIHEYRGLSTTIPLDQTAGATGNSAAANSGAVTTTAANELLFSLISVDGTSTFTAGSGYAIRETQVSKLVSMDQVVSVVGSYSGSATLGTSGPWAATLATFQGGGGGVFATDNFNRADANPIGGSWTAVTGESAIAIGTNVVYPVNENLDSGVRYTGITWPSDQYSELEVTDSQANGFGVGMGVLVRCASGARTYYRLVVDSVAGPNVKVGKFVAGTFTQLGSYTVTFVSGKKLKLAVQGTTITSFYDGVSIGTVTDSAIASGSGGIAYSSSSHLITSGDNWAGGTYP